MLITRLRDQKGDPGSFFGRWVERFQDVGARRPTAAGIYCRNFEQKLSTGVRKPPASTGYMEVYQEEAGERRV